jgi:hypoxanthine phosphoribosyltransferase
MTSKHYVSPDSLRKDSLLLGAQVLRSGFKPDFMVALWRGGATIGCYVHELLKWKGLQTDHIAIRTSRYTGIDKTNGEDGEVVVHSTSYLVETLRPKCECALTRFVSVLTVDDLGSVLLVDDVWDSGISSLLSIVPQFVLIIQTFSSGTTIVAFFKKLESSLPFPISELDIRVATVYYKPTRNRTTLKPQYYVHETTEWLVFPHELESMDLEEVEKSMGAEIAGLLKTL